MSLLSPGLIAFLTISKTGTVHGAAKILNLTQTAVTQRIRSLEREFKITLFTRSRRGMILTEEGLALYQYCREVKELEGKAMAAMSRSSLDQDVQVTVAGPTSLINSRLTKQSLGVLLKWPRLNISFLIDDTENRASFLKNGQAHFAILRPHQVANEFDSKILKPQKFILVASSSWKGRSLDSILKTERIIDFYEQDPTTINYLKEFGLYGSIERSRIFSNSNESLISLISAGIGYGTLSIEVAEPFLQNKQIIKLNHGKFVEEDMALAWYPRNEPPLYFKDIIKSFT